MINPNNNQEVADALSEDFILNTPVSIKLVEKLTIGQKNFLIVFINKIKHGEDSEQSLNKIHEVLTNVAKQHFPKKYGKFVIK